MLPQNENGRVAVSGMPDQARNIDQTSAALGGFMTGGVDYEKLAAARLLTSSEYTLNAALGYISLKTSLQTDQVLAVAYEYTYGGQTYRVGEFAADRNNATEALYVKALKNTSNNPQQANWPLMMKNVYYLASNVEKTRFRLDIKYKSDTAGVYLTYVPDVKDVTLLRGLGADRLDNNNKPRPNGYFDFVEGYRRQQRTRILPVGRAVRHHDAQLPEEQGTDGRGCRQVCLPGTLRYHPHGCPPDDEQGQISVGRTSSRARQPMSSRWAPTMCRRAR